MKILVTGAFGFIGRNLALRLATDPGIEVLELGRGTSTSTLHSLLAACDAVVHLAGENRPKVIEDYAAVNVEFTRTLLEGLRAHSRSIPLLFASSTQAALGNPYGLSKREGERLVEAYARATGSPAAIYRLPGVFGKWARPFYNSVVATFCHQVARGLAPTIDRPEAKLSLVYVDDVVNDFRHWLSAPGEGLQSGMVGPTYQIQVGELAASIQGFRAGREALEVDRVGAGLTRALYATYLTHLEPADWSYGLKQYTDPRGAFVEVLKTPDCGQFSYFTSRPGITRGGHYHHTKTEKFLVVQGEALFRFRHATSGETVALRTSAAKPTIVQTIPGWVHDVTNEGTTDLVAIVWANEVFDRNRPDTFAAEV